MSVNFPSAPQSDIRRIETAVALIIGLVALRSILAWVGFDRLPLVPALGDEVIINDPALSLSRGLGMVAADLPHNNLGLDHFYGHFPPLYILIQAAIFRLFGFSVLTLRGPAIVYGVMAVLLTLLIALRLRKAGVIDHVGFVLACGLVVLEPTLLRQSRVGRMDSLVAALGAAAAYAIVRFETTDRRQPALCVAAGALVGLALAVHFEAAVYFIPLVVYLAVRFREVGPGAAVAAVGGAALLPVGICWGAWGNQWPTAVAQMHAIAALVSWGIPIGPMITSLMRGSVLEFQQRGGIGLVTTVIAAGAFVAGLLLRSRPTAQGRVVNTVFGLANLGCVALWASALPPAEDRVSVAVPLAVLGLAVAVSRLKRPVRGAGIAVAGGLVIAELFAVGLYLSVLPRQWAARDPGRFAQLLGGLSPADSVAASPQLWYGLARSHHPMAILYPWLNGLAYWRRVPQSLDSFDVVVLDRDDELLERERGRRPTERRFVIDGRQYVVLYH